MILQPGFIVLALYTGWIYAQYSLVLSLLGALSSKHYRYQPAWVGLCALAPAFGAIIAAPFQRASYFSRSRSTPPRTDSFTMRQRSKCSSHFVVLSVPQETAEDLNNGPNSPVSLVSQLDSLSFKPLAFFSQQQQQQCAAQFNEEKAQFGLQQVSQSSH
ncbi:hypothetical protein LTR51_008536 [Lithohypha guttulata]|nr:hypothetical protein LTR51_008536 [Lithohypha guttulata]